MNTLALQPLPPPPLPTPPHLHPHPTPVRFPCTAAPLVSMLLPLAQDDERGGRVLALLDQVPYFTEHLDMDRDDLDHAPGEEEGTLVCGARKVVYADGECCTRLGCGQVRTPPVPPPLPATLSFGKEIVIPAHTLGSVVQLGADGEAPFTSAPTRMSPPPPLLPSQAPLWCVGPLPTLAGTTSPWRQSTSTALGTSSVSCTDTHPPPPPS